jgi:hypothetical protein
MRSTRMSPIDPNHGIAGRNGRKSLPKREPIIAMARSFITRSLTVADADRAYAILQSASCGLSLKQWRAFVQDRSAAGPAVGGIVTLQNRSGIVQGLCSYRIDESLTGGRIGTIDNLLVLDLMDGTTASAWLVRATEQVARRHGASDIRIQLSQGGPASERLVQCLLRAGHKIEGVCLGKRLATEG